MNFNYKELEDAAEILKVLAHPVRLCIVKGLLENGSQNVTNMQMCLNVPQSTVSQHLQKLRSAGIIQGERNGLEIKYHVCSETAARTVKALLQEQKQEVK
ncbi:ArsR/SmtB family transcription factor [Clostridium polynesiense]|uniref:ArsR/SmtB family transcription factor n=1 Tax=Clostridium polynesiense TaxID=1325933 RepID=UPI00058B46F0|nr:metalloregulator ArsR/SmtB family transcription factor [Clostridium polynesiense]